MVWLLIWLYVVVVFALPSYRRKRSWPALVPFKPHNVFDRRDR